MLQTWNKKSCGWGEGGQKLSTIALRHLWITFLKITFFDSWKDSVTRLSWERLVINNVIKGYSVFDVTIVCFDLKINFEFYNLIIFPSFTLSYPLPLKLSDQVWMENVRVNSIQIQSDSDWKECDIPVRKWTSQQNLLAAQPIFFQLTCNWNQSWLGWFQFIDN